MVDAGDSKSPAARCVGSSPTLGTKCQKAVKLLKFNGFFHIYSNPTTQTGFLLYTGLYTN
jgi:hypothetical protein